MGEHPHLGRVQAVAYLSDMYATSYCAEAALNEDGVSVAFYAGGHPRNVRALLADQADLILEPLGVANVLQTVEETIAGGSPIIERASDGAIWWAAGGDRGVLRARIAIVTAIVDTALAARQEEREVEHA